MLRGLRMAVPGATRSAPSKVVPKAGATHFGRPLFSTPYECPVLVVRPLRYHAEMSQLGIDEDYYSSFECRHDLLVETEVAAVTAAVTATPEFFNVSSLRVDANVAAGSDVDGESRVRVFRLPGQTWTQVFSPWPAKQPFELGRAVSEHLATRCVQVETTDDGWAGHALWDRGELMEVSCTCFGIDLGRLCTRFSIPAREVADDELYEETELFHSRFRPADKSGDLESLAAVLGFWVDIGHMVWDGARDVERLDLLFAV